MSEPTIVNQRLIPVDIETEMKKSFLEYAMSVIIDRALPDVRDGLKPVHRRILYSMLTQGFTPDKAHRKCATTVGDVLGRFHPHGDAAVYESMVRMAQTWSLRHTLVDGHGNFGSLDGDSAAAYRYTEARLTKISMEMVSDINKDTVDFKPNFDDHESEPVVLPAKFPNLLVNGSTGIAVGMATNIPPHNLAEVIDGVKYVIDNPDCTIDDIMQIISGPDFPTGCTILGRSGIRDAYKTGRGRIVVRSEATIEPWKNNRQRIIVSEIPYQVNKARLIEKIVELVKEKKVDGISDMRDESGREEAVRIVIELKNNANANVVLNQLYKHTQLQDSFNVNMVVIVQGKDKKYESQLINIRQAIDHYVAHQKEVLIRRTKFELRKAEERAHILEGLRIAIDHLDEVIQIIRSSKNEDIAKEGLIERFSLTEKQAQAIVDMRLGRLTGLEREKLENEYNDLQTKIKYFNEILANDSIQYGIIKDELTIVRNKFQDPRRTRIEADMDDIMDEDLIKEEDNVITLTHRGYIKRLPVDTYRSQRRGGKGVTGLTTREEDFVETLFITSTHSHILFFTNKGKVYRLKGYELPEASRTAKGNAVVNMLPLDADEKISAMFPVREFTEGQFITMATVKGNIKKTALMQYANIRKGGLIAVTLRDDDELMSVKLTDGKNDIIMTTRQGQAILFNEQDVRATGRDSMGVIGIRLRDGDQLVGMDTCTNCQYVLNVTERGFGKRTEVEEYRNQTRAGKGVLTYRVTEKTGPIVGMEIVDEEGDVLLINSDGSIIRMHVDEISILGRATQGVTLMRMKDDVQVVGTAKAERYDETEDEAEGETLDEAEVAEGGTEGETGGAVLVEGAEPELKTEDTTENTVD
ncbi:MAG: DNA gyrase subunit A [Bacillota bacterium]